MSNRYTYWVPFTAEDLHHDYVRCGMTQAEVGRKWGVSQKVVWRALLKSGIAARRAAPRNQRLERNNNWRGGRHLAPVSPRRSAYADRSYVMIYDPTHAHARKNGYLRRGSAMCPKLKVLDLFSGIGGFSLGLQRTGGFKTVAFCEIEEYPRRVLAKHWPGVPIHRDVRELRAEHVGAIDVICGGFPCQDISTAGKGAGLAGERSGLWSEYARLVGELRPRYVLVENVAALLGRGLGTVLGDLAEIGYDAEWHCIPASAVGAPHRRDRIWIVAHPDRNRLQGQPSGSVSDCSHGALAGSPIGGAFASRPTFADAIRRQLAQRGTAGRMGRQECISQHRDWEITSEPFLCGGDYGVPSRVDRLRGLGNAVVPQVVEILGKAILQAEAIAA